MSSIAPSEDFVRRAAALAARAHEGQFRRDGVTPYIRHPEAVASRVAGDPVAEAVAWLHDVLEDTDTKVETLRENQLPEDVIASVVALTHADNADYAAYLKHIRSNPVARKVKIADMLSNLADHPSERQMVKYARGLLILLE